MKKTMIIVFGLIVVLCLAAVLIWNMFPTILSHKLSKRAGVSITLSDIRLSPGRIKVDGIRVGNPSDYSKTPRALSVGDMVVNAPLTSFLDKKIVIDEMTMDDVYIGLEFDSPTSKNGNWTTIMNNISKSTKEDSDKAKAKGKTTSVLIKRLVITDLQIELAYKTGEKPNRTLRPTNRVELKNRKLRPINRIELTNISSEGGIPTAQIMNIIMQETLRNIFSKEGLQNMLDGILTPQDSGGSAMNTLKGLFSDLILLDNEWGYLEHEYEEFEEAQ